MTGSAYDAEFGVGGPSDDGVAMSVWVAFQRCAAVEETGQAARDRAPGGVLAALLAPLSGPDGGGA